MKIDFLDFYIFFHIYKDKIFINYFFKSGIKLININLKSYLIPIKINCI